MTHRAWTEALDGLERELAAVEAALAAGTLLDLPDRPWVAPELDGGIPQHLVLRAVDLLHRQDAVVAALHQTVSQMRTELSYVASVDDEARRPAGPVFLDATV